MAKKYRILSLDGGGIRGLITAIWLKRLQDELEKPLHNYFDLIAGTSTGALLACGISKGINIDKIIDLYVEKGREVFPARASRLWSRATRIFSEGISAPKYDGKGLEKALKDIFRTSTFGALKIKPTLVTTYDVLGRGPVVFKNDRPEYRKLKVWELCRASAAAPTYFPAHVMKLNEAEIPLIDGGVVANNPTACAIAESVRINSRKKPENRCRLEDFIVASFGTGQSIRRIEIDEAKEWGAAEWAFPLIDVLFDGSADSVDYIATQLTDPTNYFRFQTQLTDAYDDMDNADHTNINALIRIANLYIDSGEGKKLLKGLVSRLLEHNEPS
ncbi:patatin-like phospholipase family protein [Gimesia panareensis]|uniref:patatin-like phospholipase family protein n=1 Tax=Gimesia panareensis TaxID=2527978 RepID=UPI0011894B0E|nr:patatin-like phospholipase family protein [Gimesia panareensis]QDU50484.1 Patatin-like phospholipase [Gimesia panareensis]